MHFALVHYLASSVGPINMLRSAYDPTAEVIAPHLTILFPVPESIGEKILMDHLQSVLDNWKPFPGRARGFHKSADHWLFLSVEEGVESLRAMHRDVYTGVAAPYLRDDIEFVPHIGLGLFLKPGTRYHASQAVPSELDEVAYQRALQQAKALRIDISFVVDTLHLVKVPAPIIEWTRGERDGWPEKTRVGTVKEFGLGVTDA